MSGHGEKLGRKQEQAIAALLDLPTVKAAARKAGVGERTLRVWMKHDEAFRRAYAEARRRFLELSLGRMSRASGRAVTTMIRMMGAADAAVALRAAQGLVDRAVKGAETLDILERLEALEAAQRQRQTP
jgi:hypothetical protein